MTAKLTVTAQKLAAVMLPEALPTTPTAGGPVGASLTIMQGAAAQGNPAYDHGHLDSKER